MRIHTIRSVTALAAAILTCPCFMLSQAPARDGMAMAKAPAPPSTVLTLTGIAGAAKTLTPEAFKALHHVDVTVNNAHNAKTEKYSGVPVRELLALVAPAKDDTPKISLNLTLVIAGATDGFRVALTSCDTDPLCRSGESIIADSLDGKSLGADGAFKLVLTEDKKPGRWARNLQSLTVKSAAGL